MKGVWLEDDGLAGGREEEGVRNVPLAAAAAQKIMEFSLFSRRVTKCSAYALLYISSSFVSLIFHVGAELRKRATDNEKKIHSTRGLVGFLFLYSVQYPSQSPRSVSIPSLANHPQWMSQKIP